MHVLHRSRLGSAVAVTAISAVLAIVLTLALASGLSDQAFAPSQAAAPAPPTGAQTAVGHAALRNSPFTRSPFTSLLTTPVQQPWGQRMR